MAIDALWTPYQPSLGDHVRVRLNRECVCYDNREVEENGRRGVITSLNGSWRGEHYDDDGTHPMVVEYDEPIRYGAFRCVGGAFAAIELIPLEG